MPLLARKWIRSKANRGPGPAAEAGLEVGDKLNKRHGTSRYHQKVASWHQCGRWSLSSLPQPSGFFLGEEKKCGEQKKQVSTASEPAKQRKDLSCAKYR